MAFPHYVSVSESQDLTCLGRRASNQGIRICTGLCSYGEIHNDL